MDELREKCPWDRKQTLHDAARYLMDEAGELVPGSVHNLQRPLRNWKPS